MSTHWVPFTSCIARCGEYLGKKLTPATHDVSTVTCPDCKKRLARWRAESLEIKETSHEKVFVRMHGRAP